MTSAQLARPPIGRAGQTRTRHDQRSERGYSEVHVIRIGVLAVCFLAISAFAADMSIIGRLRQYGSHIQSKVHSTPNGDPANRWHAPDAPTVNPVSGEEAAAP